jgi:hypothetical protein
MAREGMMVADEALYREAVSWRRRLHSLPETGFEEQHTSAFVAGKLAEFGLEVHRGLGGTGVVGVLRRGGANRAIGLRADMDALNIHEANSFEYRSTKPERCTPAATTGTPPCCWARPRPWRGRPASTVCSTSSSSRPKSTGAGPGR